MTIITDNSSSQFYTTDTTTVDKYSPINSVLYITKRPDQNGNYGQLYKYRDLSSATQDFGTSGDVYNKLNQIFSQSYNPINANGAVLVYTQNINSEVGRATFTVNISSGQLAALATIANGDLAVVVDGTTYQVNGVDLTNGGSGVTVATLAIALNTAVSNATGAQAGVTSVDEKIIFEATAPNYSPTISVIAPTGGSGTDITTNDKLDVANGIAQQYPIGPQDATFTYFRTLISQAQITSLSSVKDGKIAFNVNGITYNLTNLNFTKTAPSVNGFASIFRRALQARAGEIPVHAFASNNNSFVFETRERAGSSGLIELISSTVPGGTDIGTSEYLDIASGSQTIGNDYSFTTSISAVLLEAMSNAREAGCVITDIVMDPTTFSEYATKVRDINEPSNPSQQRFLALYNIESGAAMPTYSTQLNDKQGSNNEVRTKLISTPLSDYSGVFASIYTSTDFTPDSRASSRTFSYIQPNFNAITSNPLFYATESIYQTAQNEGVDIIYSISQEGGTIAELKTFRRGNFFTDTIIGSIALVNSLKVSIKRTQQLQSIPNTPEGRALLLNDAKSVLQTYVRNGFIGTGVPWEGNLPIPFVGRIEPDRFRQEISSTGYYAITTTIQNATDRLNRVDRSLAIAYKTAGSVEVVIGQIFSQN